MILNIRINYYTGHIENGSFGHGAIAHSDRCFPLFKRCEWLVSNWTMFIWTSLGI